MTAEERDRLQDLYIAARDAWGDAERDGKKWPAAYAADDAFRNTLYAIETTG